MHRLRSSKFFWLVVALFIVQAAWIAASGRYPMAFDEEFHLRITELYTQQLSPFMATQPDNADKFQAVFRDPSYLYHYLMSWPYRLIDIFTDSQVIKVLLLRGVNIGLFASGLVLFRRLLQKIGMSPAIVNLSLLVIVLLPVTPLLAAQINYDNLLIPFTALFLILVVKFNSELSRSRTVNLPTVLSVMTVGLLAALVKYAFLPILTAALVFMAARIWQVGSVKWRRLRLRSASAVVLVVVSVASAGLFFERYGLNTIHYGSPLPDCAKVLSIERCLQSPVWSRDYKLAQRNASGPTSPWGYAGEWFYGMWLRTFFAVGGPDVRYQTGGPLTIPGIGGIVFAVIGTASLLLGISKLLKTYNAAVIWLLISVSAIYLLALWLNGYSSYLKTGYPVAINGRYLLPVLPLIIALAAAAMSYLLRRAQNLRLILAVVPIFCLLWGGGALTYILRSSDSWNWSNRAVRSANQTLRSMVGPITPGYNHPTQFLR